MTAWETAVAGLVVALLAANLVATVWAARHLRGLTVVLLDLEQRLRRTEHRAPEPPAVRRDLPTPAERESRRRSSLGLGAAAAAVLAAAIGLGVWALSSEGGKRPPEARAIPLEARGAPEQRRQTAGGIVLVLGPSAKASLVLSDVDPAPHGRRYLAWVISDGQRRVAARFTGTRKTVQLGGSVRRGAVVAVTVGRAAKPLFVSAPVP